MRSEIVTKKNRGLVYLAVFVATALIAPYILSVPEPGKICLLGTALVCVAGWGKKHLKSQAEKKRESG
jgi:hypothetical protein